MILVGQSGGEYGLRANLVQLSGLSRMTIPFLNSMLYRPAGKAHGFGYFHRLAGLLEAALEGLYLALGIAEKFGGFALGEVVAKPPVAEGFWGYLALLCGKVKGFAQVLHGLWRDTAVGALLHQDKRRLLQLDAVNTRLDGFDGFAREVGIADARPCRFA